MARVSIIVRTGIIMDIVTVTSEMAMDTVIAIAIALKDPVPRSCSYALLLCLSLSIHC